MFYIVFIFKLMSKATYMCMYLNILKVFSQIYYSLFLYIVCCFLCIVFSSLCNVILILKHLSIKC